MSGGVDIWRFGVPRWIAQNCAGSQSRLSIVLASTTPLPGFCTSVEPQTRSDLLISLGSPALLPGVAPSAPWHVVLSDNTPVTFPGHVDLWLTPNASGSLAEPLAYLLGMQGCIGVETADIIDTYRGLQGTILITEGDGGDQAAISRILDALRGAATGGMLHGAIITQFYERNSQWDFSAVDALAQAVSTAFAPEAPVFLKCFDDWPRTEICLIMFSP